MQELIDLKATLVSNGAGIESDSDMLSERSASDSDPDEDCLAEEDLKEVLPKGCVKSLRKAGVFE